MDLGIEFPYQVVYGRGAEEPRADHAAAVDPAVARDWAQAVEGLGYDFVTMGDHVLLGDQAHHPELLWRTSHESILRDPFVMFAFMAAVTSRIRFVTTILVAPQRPTALIAKQAADVDLLSGGRLVLGIGSGWNPVEYEALGQDFRRRARRMEEQIGLLRRLWTEPLVTFEGSFDRITVAGINPRPARPIPIWLGSEGRPALPRVGRLADGWIPSGPGQATNPEHWERRTERRRDTIFEAAVAAGRDPKSLAICLPTWGAGPGEHAANLPRLQALGATHCRAPGAPPTATPQGHLDYAAAVIREVGGRFR